ncbi:MAG: hypothetical protein VXW22_15160, partial [Pseudomonadota bacterium]|nr:hypothetical protein [Pseudomonadota bacterium]
MKMFALIVTAFLLTSVFSVDAQVSIYKTETSSGIRSYYISYGKSKQWNVRCSRQTSGRMLTGPSCSLEPWDGRIGKNGTRISARQGIEVYIRENETRIDFIPVKIQPQTEYKIVCGDEEFVGTSPRRGARFVAAFA